MYHTTEVRHIKMCIDIMDFIRLKRSDVVICLSVVGCYVMGCDKGKRFHSVLVRMCFLSLYISLSLCVCVHVCVCVCV
jgi:hypothetical protein